MPNGRDFSYKEGLFEGEIGRQAVINLAYHRGEMALGEICDALDKLAEIEAMVTGSKARTSHMDDIAAVLAETRCQILRIGDLQADELFRYEHRS